MCGAKAISSSVAGFNHLMDFMFSFQVWNIMMVVPLKSSHPVLTVSGICHLVAREYQFSTPTWQGSGRVGFTILSSSSMSPPHSNSSTKRWSSSVERENQCLLRHFLFCIGKNLTVTHLHFFICVSPNYLKEKISFVSKDSISRLLYLILLIFPFSEMSR